MAFLDLAKSSIARSIIFFLLLTFSSTALASESQISNIIGHRSRRSPSTAEAQDLVAERRLAALSPDSAVPANNAPAPAPSSPRLPPPPSHDRPALITPSGNSPGSGDLPPYDLSPSQSQHAPAAPITSPGATPITPPAAPVTSSSSKRSDVAVILGVTMGVLALLLVSVSAAAYFRPDWLPCCNGRGSRLTQYERYAQT